jgi:Fungal trichothecene efflux pump (TRI12)
MLFAYFWVLHCVSFAYRATLYAYTNADVEVAILKPTQSIGVPLGLSLITGLGIGGATGLGFIMIQYSIPQQLMGIGIGCLTTLRSFGGSVGVAIFNSILRSKQISELPGAITSAASGAGAAQDQVAKLIQAALSGSSAKITQAAGGDAGLLSAVMGAYKSVLSDSYRYVATHSAQKLCKSTNRS